MRQITPVELNEWLGDVKRSKPLLLDVREPWEYAYCRIAGSLLIPLGEISRGCDELDPETEVVVICHHGVRSFNAANYLEWSGFSKVYNLTGGVERWAREVDPSMPRY